MRNRLHRYRYNVVLLLATWLVACSKVPDDILSEKKMQAVQVDMQLAEAMINLDSKAFSVMPVRRLYISPSSANTISHKPSTTVRSFGMDGIWIFI